ncbi:MAG: hypothetical protein AB8F78_07080 [Saprospiraceae bacterium]
MNSLLRGLCLLTLFQVAFSIQAFAQNLEAELMVLPPYSTRLDNYTDLANNEQVVITLTNTSQARLEFYLLASITRDGSPFAEMNASFRPSAPVVLEGLESETYDGALIRDLNLSFQRADITGVSGLELDQIFRIGHLPEGEYQICIEAFDFNTNLPITLNEEAQYCSDPFGLISGSQPVLLTPENGDELDASTDEDVLIQWDYNGAGFGLYDIRYRLKMIDMTDNGIDPSMANIQMLNSGIPVHYETDAFGIEDQFYTYGFDATDPPLIQGHQYAVRITAFEENELIIFENGGHSEVHVFTYGEPASGGDCSDPDYSITAHYPLTGDTIPFNFTPCVARVDPLCDDYRRFDFDFSLRQNGGRTYERTDRNAWDARGPWGYLNDLLVGGATREQAQYFVFNLELEQTAAIGPLEPAGQYSWDLNTEMQQAGGARHADQTVSQNFVHGMPKPRLSTPTNGATLQPGNVDLAFSTGATPTKLLPDYLHLIRAERTEITGYQTLGNVFESCVVQVARSPDFEELRMVAGAKRDVRLTFPLANPEAIANELYKSLDFAVNAVDTGDYYWRVVWLTDPNYSLGTNGYLPAGRDYHPSSTWQFRIDSTGTPPTHLTGGGNPVDTACTSVCEVALPTDRTPRSGLSVGDSVRLGQFSLVTEEVSGSAAGFSGSGTIAIPFLNDLRIRVGFTGIQLNAAGVAFAGSAKALEDPMPFDVLQRTGVGGGSIPYVSETQAELFNGFISGTERLVSALTDRRAIGMPLGFDRNIGDYTTTLGIVAMDFTATSADLDLVCALEIPEYESHISLGMGDWCFRASGLGNEGRLYMPEDLKLNPGDDIEFSVAGGNSSDTTQITYAEFGCDGLTCLQLRGRLDFSRDIILPDTTRVTEADARVAARFGGKICLDDGFDLMVQAQLDAFIAPDLDNFTWAESQIWIDISDRENPAGMSVPQGYVWPSGRARNTWKGIYIPQVLMRLPDDLNASADPLEIGVDNFIVDFQPAALSFRVVARNVVRTGDAAIDGWGITIDTLYASLIQTRALEAGLRGKLEMPLTDEGEHMLYGANINTTGLEIGVSVDPRDPLAVPLMAGQLTLKPSTFLKLRLGFGSAESYVEANLHGEIDISGDNADRHASGGSSSPGMNMAGVEFEDVYLNTGTRASRPGTWRFASPQKSTAGFPISIDSIGLDFSDWEHPGFYIKPRLTLMGGSGGISGAAMLHFRSTFNSEASGIEKIGLDRVDLSEISVNANVSKVQLAGYIRWRKTSTIDEVAGGIDVTIPMGIRGKMECVFGTFKANETATYDTRDYYSYWRVNGLIQFEPGLQIFSGFALYGLGGGVSYHMERVGAAVPISEIHTASKVEGGSSADSTAIDNPVVMSTAQYRENFAQGLGLEFTVILGTFPKPDAFNMDISLSANFLNAGGLASFSLSGDAYVMTGLNDRASEDKMLWANLNIDYDAVQKVVDGRFAVYLNAYGVLTGSGTNNKMVDAHFHSEASHWFMNVGTYLDPGGINLTLGGTELARLNEYLMIGHGVPAELPPIADDQLRELLYGSASNSRVGENSIESNGAGAAALAGAGRSGDLGELATGTGFAFGTNFSTQISGNPIPFYFRLRLALGVDVFVTNLDDTYICSTTGERPGVNGWRGGGQVYAGMWGEFGIGVTLIRDFTLPLFELAAGFVLQAELPNPNYFAGRAAVEYSVLGGALSGRKTVGFEFGQKCDPINTDPLANIRVLEDLQPSGRQDVYARSAATFNFPVNKMLVLPKTIPSDGPPTFYRFKPFIDDWTIRAGSDNIETQPIRVTENGYVAYLDPIALLPANASLRTDITLKFEDYTYGSPVVYVKPGETRHYREDSTRYFSTGDAPTRLDGRGLAFTYPLERQQHFLQDVTDGKGVIQMTRVHQRALFYTEKEGRQFNYILRFIPLSAEAEMFDVPVSGLASARLTFTISEDLAPETIYGVQLLRVKQKNAAENRAALLASVGVGIQNVNIPTNASTERFRYIRNTEANGDYTQRRVTRKIRFDEVAKPEWEEEVYDWQFRTSKFSDLAGKLATLDLNGKTPHNGLGYAGAQIRGQLPEHFDEIEVYGFTKGDFVVRPLIRFTPSLGDDYFAYHNRLLYVPYEGLQRMRSVEIDFSVPGISLPFRGSVALPRWPQIRFMDVIMHQLNHGYYLDPSRSWVIERLTTGDINAASHVTVSSTGTPTASSGTGPATGIGGIGGFGGSGIGGGWGVGIPGASTTLPGGVTASSAPQQNFGLIFQTPFYVQQHRQSISNHINRVLMLDYAFRMNGGAVSAGLANRNDSRLGRQTDRNFEFVYRKALRDQIAEDHASHYFTMLKLRGSIRQWDYRPFDNTTPPLPLGSEFAERQSNLYNIRFTYAAPASLGRETVTRTFNLQDEPITSTGTGPH